MSKAVAKIIPGEKTKVDIYSIVYDFVMHHDKKNKIIHEY